MAWLMLVVAGLLEVVWAVALNQADGFTRLWPSVLGLTVALASLALLTASLKSLPVGTAYAVWVGIGAFGVAVYGMMFLGEQISVARFVLLTFSVVGVAGLRALEA